jgi:hypothetical protein
MKKAFLIMLLLTVLAPAAFSANKKMVPTTSEGTDLLPNIFIYTIPEDDNIEDIPDELPKYVDATSKEESDEDITLEEDNTVIGATTLKGYAQYVEDSAVVYLKDDNDKFVLNIKTPQKISGTKGLNLSSSSEKAQAIQYMDAEYRIAPGTIKSSGSAGNFTFGAVYENEVDSIAMLEEEAGLFTKYEKNKFTLSSSVKKSLNTTYASDYNTISVAPEFKLNSYMSLKNVLSADITRNRRSSKLVFSINPFGKKDSDRLLLELGAKETIYLDNDFTKTEFSFSTVFKL